MAEVVKINNTHARITFSKDELAEYDLNRFIRRDSQKAAMVILQNQPFERQARKAFKFEHPDFNYKTSESIIYRQESGEVDVIAKIAPDKVAGIFNTNPNKLVFKTEYVNPHAVLNQNYKERKLNGDEIMKDYVILNSKKASIKAPADFSGSEVEVAKLAKFIGQYGNIADYQVIRNARTNSTDVIFSLAQDADEYLYKSASDAVLQRNKNKMMVDEKFDDEYLSSSEDLEMLYDEFSPSDEDIASKLASLRKKRANPALLAALPAVTEMAGGVASPGGDGSGPGMGGDISLGPDINLFSDENTTQVTDSTVTDPSITASFEDGGEFPEGTELLLDDHHGIYIPQLFAEQFGDDADDVAQKWGVSAENVNILLQGPDAEGYWDAWDMILNVAERTVNGKTYTLFQDGALWAVPFESRYTDPTDNSTVTANVLENNKRKFELDSTTDDSEFKSLLDEYDPTEEDIRTKEVIASLIENILIDEIAAGNADMKTASKTFESLMSSLYETKTAGSTNLADEGEADRRFELIQKLPPRLRQKIVTDYQENYKGSTTTPEEERRVFDLLYDKYVTNNASGKKVIRDGEDVVGTLTYEIDDNGGFLITEVDGNSSFVKPIMYALDGFMDTGSAHIDNFDTLLSDVFGVDADSMTLNEPFSREETDFKGRTVNVKEDTNYDYTLGVGENVDKLDIDKEDAEVSDRGDVNVLTASLKSLVRKTLSGVKHAEGVMPSANTLAGPNVDVSENMYPSVMHNQSGETYTLKEQRNSNGGQQGVYTSADGTKEITLSEAQITHGTEYTGIN